MRILLAIDNSPHSDAAAKSVQDRPWPTDSAVRVLSVVQTSFLSAGSNAGEGILNYRELTESFVKEAQELVDLTAVKLEILGLSIDARVRQGDPRKEILDEAEDWRADLIVVGSHGQTGVQRWLVGSVAEHVVRHAPCSVEVVRRRSLS